MIYQDNYLLWNSRCRKTSHLQVVCSWWQHCVIELSHYPVRSSGQLNLAGFGKCLRAVLEVPSFIFFLFFSSGWNLGRCDPLLIKCLCGWSSVFIQLHTTGLFWISSRYWAPWVLQKSWAVAPGEEGSACTQRCEGASLAPSTDCVWIGL